MGLRGTRGPTRAFPTVDGVPGQIIRRSRADRCSAIHRLGVRAHPHSAQPDCGSQHRSVRSAGRPCAPLHPAVSRLAGRGTRDRCSTRIQEHQCPAP